MALPRPAPLEWLALVVALVLTLQYVWILDDAYVYFRYVDNLLYAKRGLVYNAGEYVEGYSSPAWLLVLVGGRAIGLPWGFAIRLLGVVSCIAFWVLLVTVNWKVSPRAGSRVNLPLLLLAPNYAVLCYFTSGIETPVVQVAAVLFALLVLQPGSSAAQIAVGLTPLLRHELALPLALVAGWCCWRTRQIPWALLVSAGLFGGAWMFLRVWYYADLLPNTFYLKDDWMIAQGYAYLLDTVNTYGLHVVLAGAFLAFLALWRIDRGRARRGDPQPLLHLSERSVMLLLAAAITAYVVRIGGDPRHYRYLAFPVCIAVVATTAGLAEHVLARVGRRVPAILLFVAGAAVACLVATLYPRQLDRHPLLGPRQGQSLENASPGRKAFHRTVDKINDAAIHRYNPKIALPAWGGTASRELRGRYEQVGSLPEQSPHDIVRIDTSCALSYGVPQVRVVQALGLTEPFLARTQMGADRPAHKYGLIPLAQDIAQILDAADNLPTRGMFRRAVESGRAFDWVKANLETIEIIERKAYNRHDLMENLGLALTFPPKIDVTRKP